MFRADNSIKNRWNATMRRAARLLAPHPKGNFPHALENKAYACSFDTVVSEICSRRSLGVVVRIDSRAVCVDSGKVTIPKQDVLFNYCREELMKDRQLLKKYLKRYALIPPPALSES